VQAGDKGQAAAHGIAGTRGSDGASMGFTRDVIALHDAHTARRATPRLVLQAVAALVRHAMQNAHDRNTEHAPQAFDRHHLRGIP